MQLSEIMSHAGLALYAEVGLVIFFLVFVAVAFRVLSPSRKAAYDAASRMPLDDEHPVTPRHGDQP
jgi:cbb3-type cytochrome oxidase subunit 3